jgi:hypothetical protein
MSLTQALDRYQREHPKHAAELVPGYPGAYRCPSCGYDMTFLSFDSWQDWHNAERIQESE